MTIVVPTAISTQAVVGATYCSIAGMELTDCAVLFDPIGSPAISFNGYALPPTPMYADDPTDDAFLVSFGPGTTEFEAFAPGAFLANRTYTSRAGTLVVSGIPSPAPEPASWAMMLSGFAGVGGALRRSRRLSIGFG